MSADYSSDTRSLAEIYSDISANVQYPMAKLLLEKMNAQSITSGLDVGSGTGDAIIYLAELLTDAGNDGYRLYGIDPLTDRTDVDKEKLDVTNKRRQSEGKSRVEVSGFRNIIL